MPTHDSDMARVNAEIERAQKTEYLDPNASFILQNIADGRCHWCGSEVTDEGCYCRECDSCARYWKDSVRKDYVDGQPRMQVCKECLEGEQSQ